MSISFRVRFDRVGKLHSTVRNVQHMEIDLFIPDSRNILYSVERQLRSSNLEENNVTIITGNSSLPGYREGSAERALFRKVTSFTQLDNATLLLVDSDNYCLRYMDRERDMTSIALGVCGSSAQANIDGNFSAARFLSKPLSLTQRSQDLLLLTLLNSNDIKQINRIEQTIETIFSIPYTFTPPMKLVLSAKRCDVLYITTQANILMADLTTKEVNSLNPSSTTGSRDGPLSVTTFQNPYGLAFLNTDTIVVADRSNGVVRVVDLHNQSTSTICKRGLHISLIDGSIASCTMLRPLSFLHIPERGQLLIGTSASIRVLHLTYLTAQGQLC